MSLEGIYQTLVPLWLVWLMVVFLCIVAWAFWPRNKTRLEGHGRIPLEDGDREA